MKRLICRVFGHDWLITKSGRPDLGITCRVCRQRRDQPGTRTTDADLALYALARDLYAIGLHTVGPDDLDNHQIAQGLLDRGWRRPTA